MNILFTSINQQPIAIKLIAVGEPTIGSNKYTTDTLTSSQDYTMGDWIVSESGFINFDYNSTSINESNYCQFVTSGADIAINGVLNEGNQYYYYNMFKDSKNIVDASELQFTVTMGKHACQNMFMNCTSLTATPSVFQDSVNDWCYAGMFFGCTSLKYASCELEGLRIGTYSWMFMNCTSLTGIAGLPSQTNAKPLCYNSMFQNCISLSTAPQIPITKFDTGCLKNMFMGCKNLNNITVNFTDWNSNNITDATENWVKGVASNGRFNKPNALTEEYSVDRIPIGWDRSFETITIDQIPTIEFGSIYNKIISSSITDYVHYSGVYPLTYMINGSLPRGVRFNNGVFECETTKIQQSESKIVNLIVFAADAKPVMANIQIKTIYNEWVPLTFKVVGQPAYLKLALIHAGNETSDVALNYKLNNSEWTEYHIGQKIDLNLNDTIAFSGSTEHFSTGLNNNYYFIKDAVGSHPFYLEVYGNIQSLVNYREFLVDDYQYAQLFSPLGLVNDASKIILPNNTTSHCYEKMFKNCNYLTAVPQLPAPELNQSCYYEMFRHCISLSTASTISATTLAPQCCKGMFYECTSLIEAPALPATQLATSCYSNMFQYCYNLKEAPVLPASTLVIDCYNRMFDNCSSLSSINVSLTSWNVVNGTSYWVNNVAQSGVFTKPSVLPEQYNPSRIPEGWRVINTYSETINIDPIPSIRYYNNSSSVPVSTDIREYVHYTGSKNLSYQISGTLPEGLTFSNGVFNCIPNSISEDQTVEVNVIVSALDAVPVTANITFELFAIDYRTLPLTFKALVSSNIGLSGVGEVNPITMYFKKNNDVDWTSYTVGDSISLSQGDIVSFSGTTSGMNTSESIHYKFISTVDNSLNVYGSIQSLVNGAEQLSSNYQYGCLFRDNKAVADASNMILPNNTTNNCYEKMFFSCSYLTGTPTLPANTLTNSCYKQMFAGCGSLLDTPQLYAENLDQYCYDGMFYGCTNLTGASPLPATVLKRSCYGTMFYNCKNLSTAPTIGGRTLEQYCYNSMFMNCTSLTAAPQLSATELANQCYYRMFRGCTHLSTAPALPATNIVSYCYNEMFQGCSSLTAAPQLPATTLADHCYRNMFFGCTSLSTAPIISATQFFDKSCQTMFKGCTNLNAITVQFEEWNPSGAFSTWVQNVAATGTFTKPSTLSAIYSDNNIPVGWDVVNTYSQTITLDSIPNIFFDYNEYEDGGAPVVASSIVDYVHYTGSRTLDYQISGTLPSTITFNNGVFECDLRNITENQTVEVNVIVSALDAVPVTGSITIQLIAYNPLHKPLTFKAVNNASSIRLQQNGSPSAINLEYKLNDGSWSSYTVGDTINLNQNDTVSFRGINDHFSKDNSNYYQFKMTGLFESLGNIQSLLNFSNSVPSGAFINLFQNCSELRKAPALPATNLAEKCYSGMFDGCSSLSAAPSLPALTLANDCYNDMFRRCNSLTAVPTLPATTLAEFCYAGMFDQCTSLSTVPSNLLPVTGLASYCYDGMFRDCTSLVSGPDLPATELPTQCYCEMFLRCTSLTAIPNISATRATLWGVCTYMFKGCTSLTDAYLPFQVIKQPNQGITWGSLDSIFENCSNLTSISVDFTQWGNTLDWVKGVAPTGIFYKFEALPKEFGNSRIPSGWIVINKDQLDVPLTFKGLNQNNSVQLSAVNSPSAITLNYKKNDGDWTPYTVGDIIDVNQNDTVAFSGFNDHFSRYDGILDTYHYYQFKMDGYFYSSGNIMSLMNFGDTCKNTGCFYRLFKDCTSLITPPILPAIALTDDCYRYMFAGCSSLSAAPDLPALTLKAGCYAYMFQNCYSLRAVPDLPATTLDSSCYHSMFQNCAAMTGDVILPATEMKNNCYNYMFDGCQHLSSITVNCSSWYQNGDGLHFYFTQYWVRYVATSGTFTKPTALENTTATNMNHFNGIPSGWTVINK